SRRETRRSPPDREEASNRDASDAIREEPCRHRKSPCASSCTLLSLNRVLLLSPLAPPAQGQALRIASAAGGAKPIARIARCPTRPIKTVQLCLPLARPPSVVPVITIFIHLYKISDRANNQEGRSHKT